MAILHNDVLQIDFADADAEGVDGHEVAGMTSLDLAFSELGREAFQ